MKYNFQFIAEGTVKLNPDVAHRGRDEQEAEMRQAVLDTFKPDEQWGVDVTTLDAFVMSAVEEGE